MRDAPRHDIEPHSMAGGALLVTHAASGVTHCVINRYAKRNALSSELLEAIEETLLECERRGNAVLVLSGQGGAFSAGADLTELSGTGDDLPWFDGCARLIKVLRTTPVISIAAVDGPCIGAGLELALACDQRVAGPSAFLRIPAIAMGLLYQPDCITRVTALGGVAVATRLFVLGESLNAQDAYAHGLVTQLADTGPAIDAASTLAVALAAGSRDALSATSRVLRSLSDRSYERAYWLAAHLRSLDSPARRSALRDRKQFTGGRSDDLS